MKRLIRNSIKTPDGTVLQSRSRHDYVGHTDKNGKYYMVDGGLDYIRRSANGDEIDLSLYDDEPHVIQRHVLKWGSRGRDGRQPLKLIAIADMETDHIQAVLDLGYAAVVYRNCMLAELRLRGVKHESVLL